MTGANPLGDFLRARREQLSPDRVGIVPSRTRRTPGLRREEVATLAGISADYYLRLEQGRDRTPSRQVLEAIARVLQLDDIETTYLFGLIQPRPSRQSRGATRVPDGVLALIDSIHAPAFVEDRYMEVLAANPLAQALSPSMRPGVNRLRAAFMDPSEQHLHDNWEHATAAAVGQFRASTGPNTDDPVVIGLVGELAVKSDRFRQLWARQEVVAPTGAAALLHHPEVGDLHLHREKLEVAGTGGQVLVIYHPVSGTTSADGIALLGTIAASERFERVRHVPAPKPDREESARS